MTIWSPIPGREQLAKLQSAQEGFVAVMVAFLIAAIIGVAGLATEAGMWYALKRQNQTATDAAALTAAFEYAGRIVTGVSTNNPSAAATSTASNNQFNTATPNTVTVNTPVCTVGNVNCTVQVVLTDQLNTLFGREYLPSTVTIATAATAAYQTLVNSNGTPVGQTCLLGLGTYTNPPTVPPTGQTLLVNGHANFNMPNCILGSLSTSSNSLQCNGCSASGSWSIAGLVTAGGMVIHGQTPPVPIITQQPLLNPYASVTTQPLTGSLPSGACTADPNYSSSTLLTLNPGFYCGLSFGGAANVKLNPGIYYIDGVTCGSGHHASCSGGNFTIGATNGTTNSLTSGASITGNGVTIVLTNINGSYAGGIDIDPGTTCNATPAVVSLTAPGPGAGLLKVSATASQGLLIYQDPTAVTSSTPSTTITTGKTSTSCNSTTVTLSGAIVTPASDLTLQGNPVTSVQGCTEFIAQSFLFGGTPQLDDSGCNAPSGSGGGTVGGSGSTGVTINQAIIEQVFLTQ